MKKSRVLVAAFTLVELLIVIVIIGILATLGITQYTSSRERALGQEAVANLQLIAAAERIYKMESSGNTYTDCQCPNGVACSDGTLVPPGCNAQVRLMLTTQRWTYNVTAGGAGLGAWFTATADRINSPDIVLPGYSACQYSITQANNTPTVTVAPCAYIP